MFDRWVWAATRAAATVLWVPAIAFAEPSQAAIRDFNAGVEKFNAGNCQAALPFFSEAIHKDSSFAEAYFARGACRYQLAATDGALMDLGDALRLDSTMIKARSLRGLLYYDLNRWDHALQEFDYVLSKEPTEPQALFNRGVIHLRRKEMELAKKDFVRFIQAHPKESVVPQLREVLAQMGAVPPEPGDPRKPVRATAAKPSTPSRAVDVEALAESLKARNQVSERYGQGVLRGERSNAIGNIQPDASSAR